MVVSAEGRAEAEVVILGREELAEQALCLSKGLKGHRNGPH